MLKPLLPMIAMAVIAIVSFSSCQKEIVWDDVTQQPGPGTGPGTGTGSGTGCNANLRLKRFYAALDTIHQVTLQYDASNRVIAIRNTMEFSEFRTINFIYENNRISKGLLYSVPNNNQFVDSVVFVYNAAGRLDSMYLTSDNNFNLKLHYDGAGRLNRVTRFTGTDRLFYLVVSERYTNGNTKKVEDRDDDGTLNSVYEYKWDDKRNPFEHLALYMLYLDDEENVFRYYGKNNYTDETFLHTWNGATATTGLKYRYNANCHPVGASVTFLGVPLFPDDDFKWEYH